MKTDATSLTQNRPSVYVWVDVSVQGKRGRSLAFFRASRWL